MYGVNEGAQKQDLQKPTQWVTERIASKLDSMLKEKGTVRSFVNYF